MWIRNKELKKQTRFLVESIDLHSDLPFLKQLSVIVEKLLLKIDALENTVEELTDPYRRFD